MNGIDPSFGGGQPQHIRPDGPNSHEHRGPGPGKPAAASGRPLAVTVTLSVEAEAVLAGEGEPFRPGKSVAHLARAELAKDEFAQLRDLPFGKIVSTLAKGGDLAALLPPAEPEPVDENPADDGTAPADEPVETGEQPAPDGEPVALTETVESFEAQLLETLFEDDEQSV